MRKSITRSAHSLFDGLVARTMPIVLKHYYAIYAEQWHPHHALRQAALDETVAYIRAKMPDAMIMQDEYAVLRYAGRHARLDGLFLEFGVRTGSTVNYIAERQPGQTIYGFDSFEGLPQEWSGWVQEQGVFAMDTLPDVRDNVELVVGRFDESLPGFLADHAEHVAFIHIDSDLYASANTVLSSLAGRIRPGTIIVFNEYFNYPNWQRHEFRAFHEFCTSHSVSYEYLCWGKFEVAVEIREITVPAA